jgi:hypothetical protein
VLLGRIRICVVHDCLVDGWVKPLALASDALDAKLAKSVQQSLMGKRHAFGPRMAA